MATIAELYQIESNMNATLDSMISASVANVYRPRDTDVKKTPAVLVRYSMTRTLNHLHGVANQSGSIARYYHDVFEGVVDVTVVTERSSNTDSHASYVGICRSVFMDRYNYNNYLTDHQVMDVTPLSSNVSSDNESNHDITNLQFQVTVGIKPTSFPTGSFA